MAEIIWTESALADLDAIADYIAIENPSAARTFVARAFGHVGQLAKRPRSGSMPPELQPDDRYRQIIEPPCRVLYRYDGMRIFIVHIMRSERLLDTARLVKSSDR